MGTFWRKFFFKMECEKQKGRIAMVKEIIGSLLAMMLENE